MVCGYGLESPIRERERERERAESASREREKERERGFCVCGLWIGGWPLWLAVCGVVFGVESLAFRLWCLVVGVCGLGFGFCGFGYKRKKNIANKKA